MRPVYVKHGNDDVDIEKSADDTTQQTIKM